MYYIVDDVGAVCSSSDFVQVRCISGTTYEYQWGGVFVIVLRNTGGYDRPGTYSLRLPIGNSYVYSLINQDPIGAVRVMNICLQRSARLLAPVPLRAGAVPTRTRAELVYTESRNADTLRTS